MCFVVESKLQVQADSKKTPQKRSAQHLPKKSSKTSECDSGAGSSSEKNSTKTDEKRQKTDAMSSLSVDTSKVCGWSLMSCVTVYCVIVDIALEIDAIAAWVGIRSSEG